MTPDARLERALAGQYRLEREIGQGGMALVYLATDLRHGRSVALKVIRPELAIALGSDRFLQEIRLVAQLNHPGILPLHDSGAAEGLVYYVMPFVDGETLRERLKRERQLPLEEAVRLASQIGDALGFAHEQGIVHRDVKPENVLLSRGHAWVADFGIARAVKVAGGDRLTETGLSLGTPAYMSPEQAGGDRDLDGRSDQYSLACVLYELLAGQPPFTGPTGAAVMARQVIDSVPPLSTLRPGVPATVQRAIERALSKVPADRFETVAGFVAAVLAAPDRPTESEKSIVVLPFANLSPDAENEYFADGLMEEVIADLSKIRALRVISRNSAIQLKGTTKDTRTIGRDLNVRYVLEGSVRRAGNSVRITAQLIDAATDAHIWAEKYPGTLDDVFAMQERLSKQIVAALEVALTPAEAKRLAERPVRDPRAYECYLRSRHETFRGTPDGLARAMDLLEAGLAVVGPNELIYAGIGAVHWYYTQWGIDPSPGRLAKIDEYAGLIRALNPDSGHGEALTAIGCWKRGELQNAVRHFKRALELDPAQPDAVCYLAYTYMLAGHGDIAVPLVQRAKETDPLSLMTHWITVFIELFRDNVEGSIEPISRLTAANPENGAPWGVYGWILGRLGRTAEAVAAFRRSAAVATSEAMADWGNFMAAAISGDYNARDVISPAMAELAMVDEFAGLLFAHGLARIGDSARALYWLEHVTLNRGLVNYPFLMADPLLVPLHPDPRFISLMAEVKRRWERFET